MMKKNFFDQKSRSLIFSNHGRGVAFYIHKSLSFNVNSKYTLMHEKKFESLFIDILLHNNQKLTIGTISQYKYHTVILRNSDVCPQSAFLRGKRRAGFFLTS